MENVLDALPPDLREYVLRKRAPIDPAALDTALAKDRETSGANVLAQNLGRSAALYRGEKVGPMAAPVPDAVKEFVLKQQMGKGEDPLGRLDTASTIVKNLRDPAKAADPDNGPPPAEWGAPPSIATRKEARSFGYGPKVPEPQDPMKAPPSPQLMDALRKAGQDPSVYPTTQAALAALSPRSLIPNALVVGPDGNFYQVPTKGPDNTPRPVPAPSGFKTGGGSPVTAQGAPGAPLVGGFGPKAAVEEEEKDAADSFGGKYFKPRPDTPPNALGGERTKLLNATGEVADLAEETDKLLALYKKHGAAITGPAAASMKTLAKHIQLLAKGPGVYDLGVLNGQDYPLLKSVIDSPNELESIFRNATNLRNFVSEVRTFQDAATSRIRTRWDNGGYDAIPVKGSPFLPRSQVDGGAVRVRYQGKTLEIPRARLAEALKDGAEEVK